MKKMEDKLKIYFGLTISCIVLDITEFIIQLIRFGHPGDVTIFYLIRIIGIYNNCNVNSYCPIFSGRLLLCVLDILSKV